MESDYDSEWKLLGIAYAYKQGELELNELSKPLANQVKTVANKNTLDELKHYNNIRNNRLKSKK